MAELCTLDDRRILSLSVYFNMCVDAAGNAVDENDSVDCEFEVPASVDPASLPDGNVEFGDESGSLEENFRAIESWEIYIAICNEELPFELLGEGLA